jgi:hypothetical protein
MFIPNGIQIEFCAGSPLNWTWYSVLPFLVRWAKTPDYFLPSVRTNENAIESETANPDNALESEASKPNQADQHTSSSPAQPVRPNLRRTTRIRKCFRFQSIVRVGSFWFYGIFDVSSRMPQGNDGSYLVLNFAWFQVVYTLHWCSLK